MNKGQRNDIRKKKRLSFSFLAHVTWYLIKLFSKIALTCFNVREVYARDTNTNEIPVSRPVLEEKKTNPHPHPSQETVRCGSSLYFCPVSIIPSVNTFPLELV